MSVTKINTEIDSDEPLPKEILTIVERKMNELGWLVSIVDQCEVPDHSPLVSETGRTPKFMTDGSDVSDVIRTGVAFPFHVEKEIDGYFGESSGSANVTGFFVNDDMSIPQVIDKFHVTGQIEMACKKVEPFCQDGVEPVNVVAYAIATYAKGWLAEKILTDTDRFSKGSISHDQGGIDMFDLEFNQGDDKYQRQLKCVTKDEQVSDWLYYQWDMRGGLHFGETYQEVAKSAGEVSGRVKAYTGEIKVTPTYKCQSSKRDEDGQSYRYIWW